MRLYVIALLLVSLCLFASVVHGADNAGNRVISTADIQWGMLNPARGDKSPKAANLWGDRVTGSATGMLVTFNQGFSSPPHIHNITYRGVVIKGLMHNDDPTAKKMWLPPGSFWTQPAGEVHITAADGAENLIYLEIDSGPYLVQPTDKAFDNGERPINIEKTNLVWLTSKDSAWITENQTRISHLWGETDGPNGTFLKLGAGFTGYIESTSPLKAVIIEGLADYKWNNKGSVIELSPSSFFSSSGQGKHSISTKSEVVLYINSIGKYRVTQ